jgi:integrase/recombinase XerD
VNPLTRAGSDSEILWLWLGDKSATTQVSYRSTAAQFVEFVGKPLADVALEDLQLWVRRLKLTDQPSTVANKMLVVKSLFSFCVKVGYLSTNVGSFLKCPKVKDKLTERILPSADCQKLIEAAGNERDRCLLSLMYVCGLRVSEVCGLTWDDLQPHDKGGKATVFGKGAKTRIVLIPSSLWAELNQLPKAGKVVFVSRTGKPLERTRVHKLVKQCAERAGVSEKVSSHWLRHSHASHAIEGGCNLRLLQQSLGHSKLETTERYLHISPDQGSSQYIRPLR